MWRPRPTRPEDPSLASPIRRLLRPTAALLFALAAACSGSSEHAGHPLAGALIDDAPDGFEHVNGPSGALDVEGVANALAYLPRDDVRAALAETGFREGYARVWEKPDDPRNFIVAVVLAFSAPTEAREFVDFEVVSLDEIRATIPLPVPEVDDAFGYGFGGDRGRTGAPTFCNLVWFVRAARAYEVRVCTPSQEDPDLVRKLARTQARLVET